MNGSNDNNREFKFWTMLLKVITPVCLPMGKPGQGRATQ